MGVASLTRRPPRHSANATSAPLCHIRRVHHASFFSMRGRPRTEKNASIVGRACSRADCHAARRRKTVDVDRRLGARMETSIFNYCQNKRRRRRAFHVIFGADANLTVINGAGFGSDGMATGFLPRTWRPPDLDSLAMLHRLENVRSRQRRRSWACSKKVSTRLGLLNSSGQAKTGKSKPDA